MARTTLALGVRQLTFVEAGTLVDAGAEERTFLERPSCTGQPVALVCQDQ